MLVKLTTSVDFESRENKGKESKFRRAHLLELEAKTSSKINFFVYALFTNWIIKDPFPTELFWKAFSLFSNLFPFSSFFLFSDSDNLFFYSSMLPILGKT